MAKVFLSYSSSIYQMTRIIPIKRFPVKGGFIAINLFGLIFAARKLSREEINHELIHSAQQRELLYVGFYLWYVVEWGCLLMKYRNNLKAYYHIRFEKEAYRHEQDLDYLNHRRHFRYNQ